MVVCHSLFVCFRGVNRRICRGCFRRLLRKFPCIRPYFQNVQLLGQPPQRVQDGESTGRHGPKPCARSWPEPRNGGWGARLPSAEVSSGERVELMIRRKHVFLFWSKAQVFLLVHSTNAAVGAPYIFLKRSCWRTRLGSQNRVY
jgi:hypothetical protein